MTDNELLKLIEEKRLKLDIISYVKNNPGTSYVELERLFEKHYFDYKGDQISFSNKSDYVIFWTGWNIAAFNLISDLIEEKYISREPCQKLVYMIDGKSLTLPVLKGDWRKLKKDHWLPCVFVAK